VPEGALEEASDRGVHCVGLWCLGGGCIKREGGLGVMRNASGNLLKPLPAPRGDNGRVQVPRDDGHSFDETSEDRRKKIAEKIQYEKEMAVEKLRKEQEEKRRVEEEIRNAEAAAKVEAEAKARREAEAAAKAEIERIETARKEKEDADREARLREKAEEENALRKKKELEDAAERERDDELARIAAAAKRGREERLNMERRKKMEAQERYRRAEEEYNRTAQSAREAENMAQAAKQQAEASSATPSDKANKTNVPGSDGGIKGNGSSSPGASGAAEQVVKSAEKNTEVDEHTFQNNGSDFTENSINTEQLTDPMAASQGPFSDREQVGFDRKAGDAGSKRHLECPQSLYTDSYKVAHPLQYPSASEMSAYGEFRGKFKGMDDDRIVVYGMRYYMSQFISSKMSDADIERGLQFISTHLPGCSLETDGISSCFKSFKENGGYYPVKIEVMPEGSVVRPHIPVYKITARSEAGKDYSRLVTYLETMLTMIWYPSTVATLSRITKELIYDAYVQSVDTANFGSLDSRLHDFGFRGCTCLEQSVIGGSAHLLSFIGSDTMSACYHVQYHLNKGVARGVSIPATEHSVMTSWQDEEAAVRNLLARFPDSKFIACVMDSYDYKAALEQILPIVAEVFKEDSKAKRKDRTFVIRPDSGDPVQQVIDGLKAAEHAFGVELNSKGFKVLKNCAVIQGDGIDYDIIGKILRATMKAGFSAENVAFGMGAGLLQKVNRDTMQFATKLSYIRYNDTANSYKLVMKKTKDDRAKWSLPGKSVVMRRLYSSSDVGQVHGPHIVCTEDQSVELSNRGYVPSMITVYDCGRDLTEKDLNDQTAFYTETHDQVRERMEKEWKEVSPHEPAVHVSLLDLQDREASKLTEMVYANKIRADAFRVSTHTDSNFSLVSRQLVWRLNQILKSD